MYSSTIMASHASMSVEWPATSGARGAAGGSSAGGSGAASGIPAASQTSIMQTSSTMTLAFEAGETLTAGLSEDLQGSDILKMLVAMLVLTYLLGNQDQQKSALDMLGKLLDMSSEQLTMSINSTTTSMSSTTQLGGAPQTGSALDIMA